MATSTPPAHSPTTSLRNRFGVAGWLAGWLVLVVVVSPRALPLTPPPGALRVAGPPLEATVGQYFMGLVHVRSPTPGIVAAVRRANSGGGGCNIHVLLFHPFGWWSRQSILE